MANIEMNVLKVGDSEFEIADAQARQDISTLKEDKADIDGYYEDMTVGDAEQLVASQYVEDSVPYNFRTTGGSADVGNREYVDGIVGGTVVWNQLFSPTRCQEALPYTHNGITYSLVDGDIVLNGTATANSLCVFYARIISGHKYLRKNIKSNGLNMWGTYPLDDVSVVSAGSDNQYISISVLSGTTLNNYIYDGQLFDLTATFGSTIADYIYSLEQATAGAGVAWFKKLFPNMDAEYSYHEDSFDEESPLITKKLRDYQPGILLSIEGLASHDTVGFNQWDEEYVNGFFNDSGVYTARADIVGSKNAIHVLPNTTYCFNGKASAFVTYWRSKVSIDNAPTGEFISREQMNADVSTFTTPADCHYIFFNMPAAYGSTYKNDICINLSWSGWRNGEYEAYQKHSYPLDDSLTLRGIPKLDSQNNLYYDGDEYLPDGTVNRKYGVVDLGTLAWSRSSFNNISYFFTDNLNTVIKRQPIYSYGNVISDMYTNVQNSGVTELKEDCSMFVYFSNGTFYCRNDSYTDAATFKAAMSGVMLVYELATPTTETAEPYQHIQVCDDFGTEEYVSTSIVPVGHNTRYPANLRDKLQHLPDLADDDGYYMIGQTNKQMHLELFRIPKAPTSPDGTYVLKATVSGGTPTYTWEAQA